MESCNFTSKGNMQQQKLGGWTHVLAIMLFEENRLWLINLQ